MQNPGGFAGVHTCRTPFLPHSLRFAVTKAEIVDRIATGTGLTRIETEAVVNGFFSTVVEALREGDNIEIRGFGTFRVQHRAARSARNPQTNVEMEIEERYVPVFKPSKEFRGVIDEAWKARRNP